MTFEGRLPVLYSFRRCPYAMRARLALIASETHVELREVILREKPAALREASPKATVPVLVLPDGTVIDESLEIMLWALGQNDPTGSLSPRDGNRDRMVELVALNDTDFKYHLDRYKYPQRYPGELAETHRTAAGRFVTDLEERLSANTHLFGPDAALADIAIAPFVRQFAGADETWFAAQAWPGVQAWLASITGSSAFVRAMHKYPTWRPDATPQHFPPD